VTRLPAPVVCAGCEFDHHCPSCRSCWPAHADTCPYHPSRRKPPEPDACAACNTPQRSHYARWSPDVRWHGWIAPRNETRKARMLARRNTTQES
jgi:hypothetical protein